MIGLMNVGSGPAGTTVSAGQCPPLYAQGLFVRAFGKSYFQRHFDWLLRRDPVFGHDSHGQTIRLYPERCYLMYRDLDELRTDDGWKNKPEFKEYLDAVKRIPDLGQKEYADRSFFNDAPELFFREYSHMFTKHISNKVRKSDIVLYLLGGNSVLARMLLQMLSSAKDNNDVRMVFDENEINLWHHGQDGDPVAIDTRRFKQYITEIADVNEMLADPLIVCQWDLWMKMAFAEEVVYLFDEESWAGVDYAPLVDLVHQRIATHPLHQQRCENYVQLAALVSSTNVSEGRRSDRLNALLLLMRPFNQESAL